MATEIKLLAFTNIFEEEGRQARIDKDPAYN